MTTLPETRTSPAESASQGDIASGASADLGLVMGGGGARAAYQVGFLRYLARRFPDLHVPIVTGVSSGGINAAHLASHHGSFAQAVRELVSLWERLTVEEVFRVDAPSLTGIGLRWIFQLLSGGVGGAVRVRGLVDTTPLTGWEGSETRLQIRSFKFHRRRSLIRTFGLQISMAYLRRSLLILQLTEPEGWLLVSIRE